MKRILWLLAITFTHLSNIALAASLPVEAFANLPDVRFVTLSPDGTKVASLIRVSEYPHTRRANAEYSRHKNQ